MPRKLRCAFPEMEAILVTSLDELPDLTGVDTVYIDFETSSFDPKQNGFYPYLGQRIAGIAITWDDHPQSFYIPIRHSDKRWNLPLKPVLKWMQDVLRRVRRWVNHNVKFDAHFWLVEGMGQISCEIWDTLTLAKTHDSDRLSHGLKELCREWCELPMQEEGRIKVFLKNAKSKNYADVPADIMGEYACEDVLGNRELFKFLVDRRPSALAGIWDTEVKMTSLLLDIEHRGLQIDRLEVKRELVKSLRHMVQTADRLHELTGLEFTNSNGHIYDLLRNHFALPVLSYTENGTASYDGDAMQLYSAHPDVLANPVAAEVVGLIVGYRKESTFKGLFLETYLEKSDEHSILHPFYNQVIRTGRMSCRDPNSQQLNKRAKRLVHPRGAFLSYDASQIEFRIIVHYIKDGEAIEAYRTDPTTDFHQWVADLCGIARSAAKNINFAVGYGAGKKKVTAMLVANPDVVREVAEEVNRLVEEGKVAIGARDKVFRQLCEERGSSIYGDYHERLPTLKATANSAANVARARGYVFNAYGRRRHLPQRFAHKAFNTIVQGCAMDYIKDRLVALAPRFCDLTQRLGIHIVASVHDEVLFEGPIETMRDPAVQLRLCLDLEHQSIPFRIPFIWSGGYSDQTWAEAAGDAITVRRGGELVTVDMKKYEEEDGDVWVSGSLPLQRMKDDPILVAAARAL